MTNDHDESHAGGSIVDTTRANMSPDQIREDNEAHARAQQARRDEDETNAADDREEQ